MNTDLLTALVGGWWLATGIVVMLYCWWLRPMVTSTCTALDGHLALRLFDIMATMTLIGGFHRFWLWAELTGRYDDDIMTSPWLGGAALAFWAMAIVMAWLARRWWAAWMIPAGLLVGASLEWMAR